MATEIGMILPHFTLRWAAGAAQTFSMRWKDDDGVGLTWDVADEVVLVIGDPDDPDAELSATLAVGGYSNWTFTSGQSLSSYLGKPLRLEYRAGGETYLWGSGVVRPA